MNYIDIAILIPLLWGGYKGFRKGFIIEVASLIALGLGIFGGIRFSFIATNYLRQLTDISDRLMPLLAFVITFIIIVLGVFSLAKLLEKAINLVALGFLNRLFGLFFGVLKYGLILAILLHLVNTLDTKLNFIHTKTKETSIMYYPITKAIPVILPEIKKLGIQNLWDDTSKENEA